MTFEEVIARMREDHADAVGDGHWVVLASIPGLGVSVYGTEATGYDGTPITHREVVLGFAELMK